MSWYDEVVKDALTSAKASGRGWLRARCPFCAHRLGTEGSRPSFSIYEGSGGYHCFRCHVRGIIKDLPEGWGYNLNNPGKRVRDIVIDYNRQVGTPIATIEPPEDFILLGDEPGWSMSASRKALDYCQKRGVPDELIWESRIGYVQWPEDRRLRQRVIIPILASDHETWFGYVARHWYDSKKDKLPYLYSDDFDREAVLYNVEALLVETDVPCLIVEGAFDALCYWPNAVAVLGTYSEQQIWMLLQARRPLVVLLDGDAHSLGLSLALRLHCEGHKAGAVRLPETADPDEVDPQWVWDEAYRAIEEGPL